MANENESNMLFWSPAVIGAGVGIGRLRRDITSGQVSPTSWFSKPGIAGVQARAYANMSGIPKAGIPRDYGAAINEMMLSGSWRRGLSDDMARRAVTEATRSSLLQGAQMPIQEIEALTKRLLSPNLLPIESNNVQQNIFSLASNVVKKYGDVGSFYGTMTAFTERGYKPGVFIPEHKLKRLYEMAVKVGRTRRYVQPGAQVDRQLSGLAWTESVLPRREYRQLNAWSQQLRSFGVMPGLQDIEEYPGKIRMANLRLTAEGVDIPIDVSLPLHKTRYRKAGSEYVMNKMFVGLPSAGGEFTSWGDYYVKQIGERLVPRLREIKQEQLAPRDIQHMSKQAIREFESEVSRYMMWTPSSSHPGQEFINDLNSKIVGVPELSDMAARRSVSPIDIDREFGILYKDYGMYPAVSGGEIMSGRAFSGFDPRSMWAYGEDFPIERRPLQFVREFTPTKAALETMQKSKIGGTFRRDMPFLATKQRRQMIGKGITAPQLSIAYALPKGRVAGALADVGLAAEEILLNRDLLPMFQTERTRPLNVGMREAIGSERIAKWMWHAARAPESAVAKRALSLTPGELIGYEQKTGKQLWAAQVEGVKQELIGMQLMRGDTGQETAQLLMREIHTPSDYMKLFGMKVTTRSRDTSYLQKIKRVAGIEMMENIDALAGIDELVKNRSLLKQQMASGLGLLANQRMLDIDNTLSKLQRARAAGKNTDFLDKQLESLLLQTDAQAMSEMKNYLGTSAEDIQKMMPDELSILRKGKQWGLDVRLIGGVLPETSFLSPTEMEEAMRIAGKEGLVHPSGVVLGMATSHVGAYPHTMGGGLLEDAVVGSMEPRGLSQLMQHQWMTSEGDAAKMLAGDIARSMRNYGPDIEELLKAQKNLLGEEVAGMELVKADLTKGLMVSKKPYMLDLGGPVAPLGNINKLYVPGTETLSRFGVFRAGTGEILQTDLTKTYDRLIRAVGAVRASKDENKALQSMNVAAREFQSAIMNEAGSLMYGRGSGSGIEGALRGTMQGSRFLPVSSVDTSMVAAEEGLIQASEAAGQSMFDELEKLAANKTESEFIRKQRQMFLRGEKVTGMVMRHPFIGPYSIQPTFIQRANIPDTKSIYRMFAPANIQRIVKSSIGDISVNVSPMLGLAGDFDDDRLIVKMIGQQKVDKATRELLTGGKFRSSYSRFAAEATVMKQLAKNQLKGRAAPALSDIDKIIMGSAKLRIGAAETAPISIALSEAKLAMGYYKPDMAPKFNVMAEMLEQQIISGKKMTTLEQNIARDVSTAIRHIGRPGDIEVKSLADITRDMFGTKLDEGITMQMEGAQPWTLKLNAEEVWKQAQGAIIAGREKTGIISQYRQMARGNEALANSTVGEVISMVESAAANRADSLANLAMRGVPKKATSRLLDTVTDTIGGINRGIRELGRHASTWYRPAFFGLATTAAAFMLLGGPNMQRMEPPVPGAQGDRKGLLPYSAAQSRIMLKGLQQSSMDLRPESIPIPGGPNGEPTAPGMMTPSTYLTSSPPMSYRVMASGRASNTPDYDSVAAALRPVAGQNGRLQISFVDNRKKLTAQEISTKLEGF